MTQKFFLLLLLVSPLLLKSASGAGLTPKKFGFECVVKQNRVERRELSVSKYKVPTFKVIVEQFRTSTLSIEARVTLSKNEQRFSAEWLEKRGIASLFEVEGKALGPKSCPKLVAYYQKNLSLL